jgi:hypothetical protein
MDRDRVAVLEGNVLIPRGPDGRLDLLDPLVVLEDDLELRLFGVPHRGSPLEHLLPLRDGLSIGKDFLGREFALVEGLFGYALRFGIGGHKASFWSKIRGRFSEGFGKASFGA